MKYNKGIDCYVFEHVTLYINANNYDQFLYVNNNNNYYCTDL